MSSTWINFHQISALILHHAMVSAMLILFCHYIDVMVKAFTLFLTYVTKVFRNVADAEQLSKFYCHVALQCLQILEKLLRNFLIILSFLF